MNGDGTRIMLICALAADGPASVPGSIRAHCHRCASSVWISPACAEVRKGAPGGAAAICLPCFNGLPGRGRPGTFAQTLDRLHAKRERN